MKLQIEALYGGIVQLTKEELQKEVLYVDENRLPNSDQYDSICQFIHRGENGKLYLIDIIVVDGEDEPQKGINFLATEVEADFELVKDILKEKNAAVD